MSWRRFLLAELERIVGLLIGAWAMARVIRWRRQRELVRQDQLRSARLGLRVYRT